MQTQKPQPTHTINMKFADDNPTLKRLYELARDYQRAQNAKDDYVIKNQAVFDGKKEVDKALKTALDTFRASAAAYGIEHNAIDLINEKADTRDKLPLPALISGYSPSRRIQYFPELQDISIGSLVEHNSPEQWQLRGLEHAFAENEITRETFDSECDKLRENIINKKLREWVMTNAPMYLEVKRGALDDAMLEHFSKNRVSLIPPDMPSARVIRALVPNVMDDVNALGIVDKKHVSALFAELKATLADDEAIEQWLTEYAAGLLIQWKAETK